MKNIHSIYPAKKEANMNYQKWEKAYESLYDGSINDVNTLADRLTTVIKKSVDFDNKSEEMNYDMKMRKLKKTLMNILDEYKEKKNSKINRR